MLPRHASRAALALAAMSVLVWNGSAAQSQRAADDGADWPSYNRDLGSLRYSPLRQINTENVGGLREAWRFRLGRNWTTGTLTGGSEFTPLVIDGVMYLAAADQVVALTAHDGQELWRYDREQGAPPPSHRGMAYWPGNADNPPRLYFTAGRLLIGLSPVTGERAWRQMPVLYYGAPVVYENLVIVGSNSAPGSVRAFDAVSGDEVWVFDSVPKPGQAGHDSWEDDAWQNEPNLLHWAFAVSVDAERGIVYAVFESAGPEDYYGGNRPGNTLFSDSIVAIDAKTGERRWHFQAVHHDIWDYDLPAPPSLFDIEIDGVRTPMLAAAGKTGYMYVLNRVTGEPVFGIEERPVPQSDVPGEKTSPTQPIPVKPPPLAKTSYAAADLVTAADTTAEHAQFCRELVERSGGLRNAGPFTPYGYRAPGSDAPSTILFPGDIGGANWGGTAVDPELGYVFINTMDEGSIGWIEARPESERTPQYPLAYRRMSVVGRLARFWSRDAAPDALIGNVMGGERNWPCNKPPWGHLTAVNAATGEFAWRVPLGITEELEGDKQRTGRLNMGGPTATAGGLVFIGATNDRRFRAFDSRTGEELWVTRIPMSAHANPISYLGSDGKQYVAIIAAGASGIDDPSPDQDQMLIVYSLP